VENPFNYLQFATGDHFYGREEIRTDLRSRFLSGQTNVVIYGPRRYGKSSLEALANERIREFDDSYRRWYALGPSSTVNSAKRKLMEDGHIEQVDGECMAADSFFAKYLRSI